MAIREIEAGHIRPNAAPSAGGAQASGKNSAPLSLSLVAACRNESNHIRKFLDSLLLQDMEGFNWEIVIADGMSTDDTRTVLDEYAASNRRVVVIDNPAKVVSSGLNSAIRSASGEIILRMDAHTEYAPDYVRKCVEALEKNIAENVGGPARTRAEGTRARAIQAAYHSRFSTGGARFHDDNYSGYVDTVPYGCWRKETLLKLGLFDEELVRNQDDELNLRLIRSGGRIWQSSDIVSWYRPRSTLATLFRQYFQYGFWKVRVIQKHKLPGSWRHLVPGAFVAVNVLLPLIALAFLLAGSAGSAQKIGLFWMALLAFYTLVSIAASVSAASRFGWALLFQLPIVFAVFHVSYGLGFLLGSLYWAFAKPGNSKLGSTFVGVTR